MLTLNKKPIDFTSGFVDLHTKSYQQILNGKGFGLLDGRPAIEVVSEINHSLPKFSSKDYHPFLKKYI